MFEDRMVGEPLLLCCNASDVEGEKETLTLESHEVRLYI